MKTDFNITENGDLAEIEFKNFYDKEQTKVKNHQTFIVKKEFMNTVNWDTVKNSMDLFKDTNIQNFLHNPNGYATIDHKNNRQNYFLNGKLILTKEEFDKEPK